MTRGRTKVGRQQHGRRGSEGDRAPPPEADWVSGHGRGGASNRSPGGGPGQRRRQDGSLGVTGEGQRSRQGQRQQLESGGGRDRGDARTGVWGRGRGGIDRGHGRGGARMRVWGQEIGDRGYGRGGARTGVWGRGTEVTAEGWAEEGQTPGNTKECMGLRPSFLGSVVFFIKLFTSSL